LLFTPVHVKDATPFVTGGWEFNFRFRRPPVTYPLWVSSEPPPPMWMIGIPCTPTIGCGQYVLLRLVTISAPPTDPPGKSSGKVSTLFILWLGLEIFGTDIPIPGTGTPIRTLAERYSLCIDMFKRFSSSFAKSRPCRCPGLGSCTHRFPS